MNETKASRNEMAKIRRERREAKGTPSIIFDYKLLPEKEKRAMAKRNLKSARIRQKTITLLRALYPNIYKGLYDLAKKKLYPEDWSMNEYNKQKEEAIRILKIHPSKDCPKPLRKHNLNRKLLRAFCPKPKKKVKKISKRIDYLCAKCGFTTTLEEDVGKKTVCLGCTWFADRVRKYTITFKPLKGTFSDNLIRSIKEAKK